MKRKYMIFLILVLLSVGFATVSTFLYLNGATTLAGNPDDLVVYFSDAYENGVRNTNLITDDSTITFSTKLSKPGETYVIKYEVFNASTMYDANISFDIDVNNSEYISASNDFDTTTVLKGQEKRTGVLTITMLKSYPEEDALDVPVSMDIVTDAKGREDEAEVETIYDYIKNKSIGSSDSINFNVPSYYSESLSTSSSEYVKPGVYQLVDDSNVYFYRGTNDDVNVILGDYCWVMMRTTSNKGVKLLYNGETNKNYNYELGEDLQVDDYNFKESQQISATFNNENTQNITLEQKVKNNTISSLGIARFNNKSNNLSFIYSTGPRNSVTFNSITNMWQSNSYYMDKELYVPDDGDYLLTYVGILPSNGFWFYSYSYDDYSLIKHERPKNCSSETNICSGSFILKGLSKNLEYDLYFYGNTDDSYLNFKLTKITLGDVKSIDCNINSSGINNSYYVYNSKITDPAYVGYMYGDDSNWKWVSSNEETTVTTSAFTSTDSYYYGTNYTFDETTGQYTLSGTITNGTWSEDNLNKYTCLNTSSNATCYHMYYFTSYDGSTSATGIDYTSNWSGSTSDEEANENINDSNIKKVIDEWYSENMTDYTDYLEDTVWCNDRSLLTDTSNVTNTLTGDYVKQYAANGRSVGRYVINAKPSLKCANTNDSFTVSEENGNGKLTYPVATVTSDELVLSGYTSYSNATDIYNDYYEYLDNRYWTMTPSYAFDGSLVGSVYNNLFIGDDGVNDDYYTVRPMISLKYGLKFKNKGNGSQTKPFVVDLSTD